MIKAPAEKTFANHLAKRAGFSLIEIVIVVAIIAILAALAIPLYLNYTARAEGSAALSLAQAFKPAVVTYFSLHNTWKGVSNKKLGMPGPTAFSSHYVSRVGVGRRDNPGYTRANSRTRLDVTAEYCSGPHAGPGGQTIPCEVIGSLQGKHLTLSAYRISTNLGTVGWRCFSRDAPLKYLPANCRYRNYREASGHQD